MASQFCEVGSRMQGSPPVCAAFFVLECQLSWGGRLNGSALHDATVRRSLRVSRVCRIFREASGSRHWASRRLSGGRGAVCAVQFARHRCYAVQQDAASAACMVAGWRHVQARITVVT